MLFSVRTYIQFLATSYLILTLSGVWNLYSQEETTSSPESQSSAKVEGPDQTVQVDIKAADSNIRDRLQNIFTSAERFQNLKVEVRDGIVFLYGKTNNEEFKQWATEVSRKTQDVVAVINNFKVESSPLHWRIMLSHLLYLAIAYILALPIAWNREKLDRSAGLRTFPIVSVAACGYMLIALFALESADAQSRVMYGIITGIGFIGGGAILKDKAGVRGTATAASIWNTAAIGVAVAWRHLEIAIVLSALNFFTLRVISRLKATSQKLDSPPELQSEENTP